MFHQISWLTMTMSQRVLLMLSALIAIHAVGCTTEDPIAPTQPGELIQYDSIGRYDVDRLNQVNGPILDLFFTGSTMQASYFRDQLAKPQQGVKLYRVAYKSVIPEKGNQPVTAYGLVAIPENVQPGAPILSYQHGTIFERSWCPSNPDGSLETQFILTQFASQGYIVIAPDYFGLTNTSTVPNTFFIPGSTAQACIDMYRASLELLRQNNITPGKLFVHGWSQGGYCTLTFLRALEVAGISVAGASTASGPADPLMFVNESLFNPPQRYAPFTTAGFSNLFQAYEYYYDLAGYFDLSIKPEYLAVAKDLYQFKVPYQVFEDSVKKARATDVFTQQFLEDAKIATKPFWRRLDEAASYRWRMRTPLRTFYSIYDEAVPIAAAKVAALYQNEIGNTNAQAIDAGPIADHRAVSMYALINIKPWFDSLR